MVSAVDDTNLSSASPVTVNIAVRQPVRMVATGNSDLRLLTVNVDNIFQVFTTDPPTGQPIFSAPLSQVGSFEFDGGLGDDTLIIASPLPFTPVFHGQAGHDSLIVRAGNYTWPDDVRAETDLMSLQVSGPSSVNLGGSQEFSNMILIGLCKVGLIPGTSASLGVESLSIGRKHLRHGRRLVRVAANADTQQCAQIGLVTDRFRPQYPAALEWRRNHQQLGRRRRAHGPRRHPER